MRPDYLIVALHGWGANAEDLVPIASELKLSGGVQYLFPEAPYPHPQVAGGKAWYELATKEYKGLAESRQALLEWLLSLENNLRVPLERTFLMGFSQGGAMTLDVGLNNLPLMGICSLSGYLHSEPTNLHPLAPAVLMIHGTKDAIVPVTEARKACHLLSQLGANIAYHELNMGHEISTNALYLLRDFISERSQTI